MTIAKAKLNYFRMSPRKVREVVHVIKKLDVSHALKKLLFINKKAARDILKLLKSAIANAKNKGYNENDLYVKNIFVQEGPKKMKRYYPKARGAVGRILKAMSHITIELDLKSNFKKESLSDNSSKEKNK